MTTLFAKRFSSLLALALIGALAFSPARAQELPPGSQMPAQDVRLDKATGGSASLSDLAGEQGTAVVFWSNRCPWVDKYEGRLMELASSFSDQSVSFVLVNSNDGSAFPKESKSGSRKRAESAGYEIPYLMDKNAKLAEALGAARTPHVFLLDGDRTLAYVGTIDDSPGDPGNVSNAYLKNALNAVVAGESVPKAHTKAFGCTIKAGN
jgi:thiol-disulfide isomerase/thioredoxin